MNDATETEFMLLKPEPEVGYGVDPDGVELLEVTAPAVAGTLTPNDTLKPGLLDMIPCGNCPSVNCVLRLPPGAAIASGFDP